MLDQLRHGRECYASRSWTDAYQSLLLADQASPLDVEDLERLATSAYLAGRELDFQRCLERLHRAHLNAEEPLKAARCTYWLALSFALRGEIGQANAWIARGQRLVGDRECAERGHLILLIAEQHLAKGDAGTAYAMALEAAAISDRCDDAELVAAVRHVQGRALIQQDRVVAGLGFLDETMLLVIAGDLSPIMTGLMYCSVIEACREVYALSRAREWTVALTKWCEQQSSMVAFTGICLVHRAEIMQFHGAWPDAMAETLRACARALAADRKPPAAAFYQQAEIHRLRGEFAEAEDAYRRASQSGREPQPGLALLRLAQGQTDAACAAIRRLVSGTTERPQRARYLAAHVDIMLAVGDLEGARAAAHELHELAETFDTDALRAAASQAQGAIALTERTAHAALGPLRNAFEWWTRLEAPYEAARVRVLIGQAYRALGDEDAGALEFDAARAVFEQLEARPDLTRLDGLDTRPVPQPDHPLTVREREVLRLVAAGHTNKAIAAALCVSERTVDRHISNILGKLDVPSRTAATAYAYDHKLF